MKTILFVTSQTIL